MNENTISTQSKPPVSTTNQRSHVGSTNTTSTSTKSSHHRISNFEIFFLYHFKKYSQFLLLNIGSATTKDESSDENLIWKHEIDPLIETLKTAYESIESILINKIYFLLFFRKSL